LVYFVSSNFQVGKTRGIYNVNYACNPENVSKARAIIVRDLGDMQKTPVSADDLRQAKAMLLRQVPLSEASVDRIAEGWIGRSTIGLPLDEPYVAAQRYVALTAEQVQAAYAKWLRPNDLVEVTQGPNPQ
jgi:zinc protease